MADRYWVLGSGNWDAATTTNWAATSGGAGGASAPTSADNVIFDALSDRQAAQNVTSITRVGTTATVTCNGHGYANGNSVTIAGATQPEYNGTFTITNVAANTFDYTVTGTPATPATGTITVARRAAFTVTVTGTSASPSVSNDLTASGLTNTMTLSLPAGTARLDVYGSLYWPASNFAFSGEPAQQCIVTFRGATTGKTITTNGVAFALCVVSFSAAGEWTLGSSLTVGNSFRISSGGTLNTANYNIVSGNLDWSNGTINLGSSTVTGNGGSGGFLSGAGLTLNAGTSQINFTQAGVGFASAGHTFYNVSFTNTAAGTHTISGANTFNNLTFAARAASGIGFCSFSADQTITGTFTVQSGNTDPTRRIRFNSNTLGTQRTITAAAVSLSTGIDFRDIAAAGAASPWNVSSLAAGDCKGNSNITFPAAKTVYRRGTGNFSATQWASSSGGSPAADQFPLAQDTMVFDANTTTGTHTINFNYQLGTLTMTNSTTVTLSFGTNIDQTFYGDITLGNAVTLSGIGLRIFFGTRTTQNITSVGKVFPKVLDFSTLGTVVLQDNLTSSTGESTITRGTLDLNNNILSVSTFSSATSNTRTITFGTGKIQITATNNVLVLNLQNGTLNISGTGLFELTNPGSVSERRVTNFVSSNVSLSISAGSDTFRFEGGANQVKNLNFTGFSGTWNNNVTNRLLGDLTLSSTMTITGTATTEFQATSGTQQITTNGKTLDFPITKSGAGTLQLQDNLTMGSTRTFTHTAGTVNLNGRTLTVGTDYSTSNSNVRAIAFGVGGLLICPGNFTATLGTNLATTGTGTIQMTSASAKTFAGGGRSYPVLDQAGAGALTISGSNSFQRWTNTAAGQITVTSGTTQTLRLMSISGVTVAPSSTTNYTITNSGAIPFVNNAVSISRCTMNNGWTITNGTNGGNNTGITFLTQSTVYGRLKNTGELQVDRAKYMEFDETAGVGNRLKTTAYQANELDEVTIITTAMRQKTTDTTVNSEFNEIGII